MKVSVIGSGNMARGIGSRVVAGGNELEVVARNGEAAQALAGELGGSTADSPSGDVVVLAVPYPAVGEVLSSYGDALAGKVLVDITNPVDWSTMQLATSPGTSAAEEIAKQAPGGASVVKAFNTNFAGTLVGGQVAGQPLDVFLAGDDAAAKEKVASVVNAGGLRALDVGGLSQAQRLEPLGLLHITAQESLGSGFGSALKIVW
jgi:predicted dinucleotide-binding enzyme